MSWKRVTGITKSAFKLPEWKLMKTDEDEEEWTVIPEDVPTDVPVPVKEPVKEPQKVPASRRAQVEDLDEPGEKKSKPERTVKGELLGYRHGLASKRDGQWILHSPIKPMPWERGVAEASCGAGRDHVAPQKDCSCGLYAKHTEPSLNNDYGTHEWVTQVKAWGKVCTGVAAPDVMRAQYMQISGIRPPKCEQCDKPASHLISANESALSGRPTCEDHKPDTISGGKIKVVATPVEEVSKALSDYYGGAKVVPHGKSWSDDEGMDEFEKQFEKGSSESWARVGYTFPK